MAEGEGADLTDLVRPGRLIDCRVTPRAARPRVGRQGDLVLLWVTAAPADGAATEAARRLLAGALGVAPSRLALVRGAASRSKRFRLD
jgi:hypothetical protein